MTITQLNVKPFHDVLPGIARFDSDAVTFGSRADGSDVTIRLTGGGLAQPTLVVGQTGAGKTELIRSLHAGANAANITAHLADPFDHTAAQVIRDHHALVHSRAKTIVDRNLLDGRDLPLRILLADHLSDFDSETLDLLTEIVKCGRKVKVAVIVSAIQPDGLLRGLFGAGNLIEMRSNNNGIPSRFADGTRTAGIGLCNGDLFRAWMPAS